MMHLPSTVVPCIRLLEAAGYQAHVVGGCVRDSLLGITPHDYDLCTNATPEETAGIFADHTLVRSGEKHGTIGVVINKQVVEITTFRTEGGYQDSRHPDWVRFVSNIEEDLARRDFTVNAMAYHPDKGYIDPFGGQEDLKNKILRTVGEPAARFSEDALRILRGVRFAVRFGLTPTDDTLQAMKTLAPTMDSLARERVFDELCKLLPLVTAKDLEIFRDVLVQVVPPLAPCVGFLQHNPHHIYDVYGHTAKVVEAVSKDPVLRFAALLHDCGKPACFSLDENGVGHFYGHAQISAQIANDYLLSMKSPTAMRDQVVFLIAHHMDQLEPDKKQIRRKMGSYGKEALLDLVLLQFADMGKAQEDSHLPAVMECMSQVLAEDACLTVKDLAIDGRDLLALGYSAGPDVGFCLHCLLERVQMEDLPNERQALLAAAKDFLK